MMSDLRRAGLVLACAALAQAQGFGGYKGGGGNPYSDGDDSSYGGNSYSDGGSRSFAQYLPSRYTVMVTAHAVLATLAFGLFFPVGGILIRIASFPGLWWVHGLFQIFAYLLYTAGFAIGVYMASKAPSQAHFMSNAHPIIGIILFVLLFFQPFLGFLHHVMFKKHSRRVVWSYGHIWLGRAIITAGVINGGLGLQLAKRTGFFAPSQSTIIVYSVVAAIIWLTYMGCAIFGEMRRRSTSAKGDIMPPPSYQQMEGHAERKTSQYA